MVYYIITYYVVFYLAAHSVSQAQQAGAGNALSWLSTNITTLQGRAPARPWHQRMQVAHGTFQP